MLANYILPLKWVLTTLPPSSFEILTKFTCVLTFIYEKN
ncbi:MAG: hypothetical protein OFPII_43910 [Osedax symbiont Rs1]|nr:MAG: hypothetical protein OFPII_43910 [Osedax symbiont Rs1]